MYNVVYCMALYAEHFDCQRENQYTVRIFLDVAVGNAVGFALEYFSTPYYISEMEKKRELMTAREFARRLSIPYTTVAGWLQKGQVLGAEAQVVGTFKVWMVPVEALKGFERPKRGRPPLTDEQKTARAKKKVREPKAEVKKTAKKGARAK